jgi:hypothetical protein
VKSGRLGGYLFFAGSLVLVGLIFWSLSGCAAPMLTDATEIPEGIEFARCTDYSATVTGRVTATTIQGTGCQCIGTSQALIEAVAAKECQ